MRTKDEKFEYLSPTSPQPLEEKDNIESSNEEVSLENCTIKEVEATLIDHQDPSLALTPTSVRTIEWWGYPGMQAIYMIG